MSVTASGDLPCQELVELVTDYLEGALAPDDRARFDRHLATCPHCRTYLEQMRLTVELTGRLAEDDLPSGSRDALLDAFRTWKATAQERPEDR